MADEIDFAVFGKGVFEALEKAKKPPEAPKEPVKETVEVHEQKTEQEQKPEVRTENGVKYIRMNTRNAVDVIKTLDDVWHPTTHDSLSCPSCKPLIENYFKEKGYGVNEDKNGIITISPKKNAK